MTELSPAAQAVYDAAFEPWETVDKPELIAAAVLRAAAEQILPRDADPSGDWSDKDEIRSQLFAIADELETQ